MRGGCCVATTPPAPLASSTIDVSFLQSGMGYNLSSEGWSVGIEDSASFEYTSPNTGLSYSGTSSQSAVSLPGQYVAQLHPISFCAFPFGFQVGTHAKYTITESIDVSDGRSVTFPMPIDRIPSLSFVVGCPDAFNVAPIWLVACTVSGMTADPAEAGTWDGYDATGTFDFEIYGPDYTSLAAFSVPLYPSYKPAYYWTQYDFIYFENLLIGDTGGYSGTLNLSIATSVHLVPA